MVSFALKQEPLRLRSEHPLPARPFQPLAGDKLQTGVMPEILAILNRHLAGK